MLLNNLGTIVVTLVLLGIVTAVILKIRQDRKKSKSAGICAGCSCGCVNSAAPPKRYVL